jgi:hypothetical protein
VQLFAGTPILAFCNLEEPTKVLLAVIVVVVVLLWLVMLLVFVSLISHSFLFVSPSMAAVIGLIIVVKVVAKVAVVVARIVVEGALSLLVIPTVIPKLAWPSFAFVWHHL